ncbi:Putative uncharacterized protein [Moritella viscosa]|nr:Putative uncharacterized protein [Moritella viscosa]
MTKQEIEAFAKEAAEGLKSQQDTSINYRNGHTSKTLKTEDGQF